MHGEKSGLQVSFFCKQRTDKIPISDMRIVQREESGVYIHNLLFITMKALA